MESSARKREELTLTPREIYERLNEYVIGQDAAKRAVSIAAYHHVHRIQARGTRRGGLLKKSNILLIGPTGSGKTHIARNLSQILSVPFTTVDATEYTEAGYYGKDVEAMIANLLFHADHSVEDAQRGIIFIDEVDKIARRTQGAHNGAGSRDIGGEGVQQALLKMLEGRTVQVPMNVNAQWGKRDFVEVDTKDILFICAGTFTDLLDSKPGAAPIGFGASIRPDRPSHSASLKKLIEFGMLSEFLGRLPVIVSLQRLTEDELLRVLTEPPDSVLHEFQELLELEGLELRFEPEALQSVVRYASSRGFGARGLRSVLEHVLSDILFEAPERARAPIWVDAALVEKKLEELRLDL